MIKIGLTGWSDHPTIQRSTHKLEDYAMHFPIVEMDTSFYAIPPEKNILSWMETTPDIFQFIPKAYSGMTGHRQGMNEFSSTQEMFDQFKYAFNPLIAQGRIACFLFQFPPTFECTRASVHYLRQVREWMGELKVAVEFRHPSWFSEAFKDKTLEFLEANHFIHVIVDQPQTPANSVPFIPEVTHSTSTMIRLHGRNYRGWLGEEVDDWRKERTLYHYSTDELTDLAQTVKQLDAETRDTFIIFNNNSGGHAAPNAKELKRLLGIEYTHLGPQQTQLF